MPQPVPFEIILEIFEIAARSHLSTAAKLLRVSKFFLIKLTPIVYQTIVIQLGDRRLPDVPDLTFSLSGCKTRSMALALPYHLNIDKSFYDSGLFDNLTNLAITFALLVIKLPSLPSPALRQVTNLTILQFRYGDYAYFPLLRSIFKLNPQLQHLHILRERDNWHPSLDVGSFHWQNFFILAQPNGPQWKYIRLPDSGHTPAFIKVPRWPLTQVKLETLVIDIFRKEEEFNQLIELPYWKSVVQDDPQTGTRVVLRRGILDLDQVGTWRASVDEKAGPPSG